MDSYIRANNLKIDGIAGSNTQSTLYSFGTLLLKYGIRGIEVIKLQQSLNNKDYSVGNIDGIYGSKTKNAVINFQWNSWTKYTKRLIFF